MMDKWLFEIFYIHGVHTIHDVQTVGQVIDAAEAQYIHRRQNFIRLPSMGKNGGG